MSVGGLPALTLSVLAVATSICGGSMSVSAPSAEADPGVLVYPGMEIHQGSTRCTLGYVDIQARTGYTAGHCRGDGAVTDRDGHMIGNMIRFVDNTPDGATVATDHQISDWESITLVGDVMVNNILPDGRMLVADPGVNPQPGEPVCHFGVVTGETCGTVQAVNNGWFTMDNGIVSQKGDSGGPVYTVTPDNRAVMVGVFNSTWGQFPAAVSWNSADQQVNDAVVQQTAGGN
ncbi:hypothetical protein M2432_004247 [Mycobacterium sp. OTB74]|jgi:hypothetical protein|nr:hypothetical protein [Mycobacterium sp. OTB74]